MIKCLLFTAILALNACSSTPDIRPHAVIQSETAMQQGLKAYQRDKYLQAINWFTKALILYQSIDQQTGIILARINLIESALAISRFDLAEQNLAILANRELLQTKLTDKIILLKAHNFFLQEHYDKALDTLHPLLTQLPDFGQKLNAKQINLLLTQTKFAIFAGSDDANNWFKRLKTVMDNYSTINLTQQALYKRLSAHIALQKQNKELAISLMQQAIDSYKSTANRRAIATCLQEIAQFYYARKNFTATHESLNRALLIRKWLKDTYKTTALVQQLKLLDSQAVTPDSELISINQL